MNDEKVYTPEVIQENPLPGGNVLTSFDATDQSTNVNASGAPIAPASIKEQLVPTKRIATELLSSNLNTKSRKILGEFQFTPSGAIKIGNYQEGVSGEILISPNGIVTKDTHGNVTIGLDGLLGSAVFAGEIQAGSLISGAVAVGDGNILIDGATRRMLFYDANGIPQIVIGLVS